MIEAFLQNDKSYDEYAAEVGLTRAKLRYRVKKYQEQQELEKRAQNQ